MSDREQLVLELGRQMRERYVPLSPATLYAEAHKGVTIEEGKRIYRHAAWHAGMFERTDGSDTCPVCGEPLPTQEATQ